MKKISLLIFLILLTIVQLSGQILSVGHRTVTFNDPARTGGFGSGGGAGRQIQTEIYYPSSAAADGDSTVISSGQFPILIFGHGFVMVWSSYDNIWKDLVPQGYIICFPRTEGSASPNHTDFGKDLALLQNKMLGLNTTAGNHFFNTMTNKVAIMGHSMGGGSSFLACEGNASPTTMVTFAAANTNPSSIVAAGQVTIPTLLIAGGNDCVAPPAKNQDSMYLQTASSCKAEITITGAAHCEFANSNTACSFGESTCSPSPTISAAQQKSIASVYYSNWLRYWLKGDCPSWNKFIDSANLATNIHSKLSCSVTCTLTGMSALNEQASFTLSPNPTNGILTLRADRPISGSIEIYEAMGRLEGTYACTELKEQKIDVSLLKSGMYFLILKQIDGLGRSIKFIKE